MELTKTQIDQQDFVSACDNWWNSLLIEDKQNVYKP